MTDFSDALRAVRAGRGAYRAEWRENGYEATLRLLEEGPLAPVLVMDYPGQGPRGVFAGGQRDLLAGDWELSTV